MKWIFKHRAEILVVSSIVLLCVISFNLGKLYMLRKLKEPLKIYDSSGEAESIEFQVFASRNSNKYHFPWCSGTKNIKPENMIVFENENAAIAAGYILAGNCSK